MTNIPIEALKLNWRITRKLRKNGIPLVNILVKKTESDLWNDCGLNRHEIDEIKSKLLGMELTLRMCDDDLLYLVLEDE